jgi:hypothetical protein
VRVKKLETLDKSKVKILRAKYLLIVSLFKKLDNNIKRCILGMYSSLTGNFFLERKNAMKTYLKEVGNAIKTTLLLALLAILAACGGGGSSEPAQPFVIAPPPPVTFTYTAKKPCAIGPALTSTVSQSAADELVPGGCPPVPTTGLMVSIVGDKLVISGTPAGVAVKNSNLTATNGASTVTYVDGVKTSGTLLSDAIYTFVGASATFNSAGLTTFAGTFTSPVIAMVCTAPAMLTTANTCISPPAATGYAWNAFIKAWVANVGVRVFNPNLLPVECKEVGDGCWVANVANGMIKFVQSDAILQGLSTEKSINAYYRTTTGPFGATWVFMPLDSTTGKPFGQSSTSVNNGGVGSNLDWIQGAGQADGVIVHQASTDTCTNWPYFPTTGIFQAKPVICPSAK